MTRVATATLDAVFRLRKGQELQNLRSLQSVLTTGIAPEEATRAIKDRFELRIGNCLRELDAEAVDTTTLLEVVESKVRPIVTEVQAYVHGVLFRRAGLDNGIGAIASRMLNGLASRAGVEREVLLGIGDAEFIVHTFNMIRMRHQDADVWRLPILVHELGHHVADHLRNVDSGAVLDKFPVIKSLANGAGTDKDHSHLHELFADVFATYATGGAFPICAIVEQARPDQRFGDHTDTHPSWPARVRTMLSALRAMSTIDRDDPVASAFADTADNVVEPLWSALTADHPDSGEPASPAELDVLRQRAEAIVDLLVKHTPAGLRFRFTSVYQLTEGLASRQPTPLPEETTTVQVLDAAWRWRVGHLDASTNTLATVSRNALRWCETSTD